MDGNYEKCDRILARTESPSITARRYDNDGLAVTFTK